MPGYIDASSTIEPSPRSIAVYRAAGFTGVVVEGCSFTYRCVDGFIVACRATIIGESERELKRRLRGIKLRYPIVAVVPRSVQAARFAARDRRVDIIVLSRDSMPFIDRTEAGMMKRSGKLLEARVSDYLGLGLREKAMFYRRLALFRHMGADILVSSGATDIYGVYPVKSLIAIASNIYGLDPCYAEASITTLIWKRLVDAGVRPCR